MSRRPPLALSILAFFSIVGGTVAAAPPGEPVNLRWCPGSRDCLSWDPASPSGRYRVLRGTGATLPELATLAGESCSLGAFAALTTGAQASVAEEPPPGGLFWYVVQAVNCSAAGPAGEGAEGPRLLDPTGDCAVSTCTDGVQNGQESAVDCGGPECPDCVGGGSCCAGADCDSALCMVAADLGICSPASCVNGVTDANETDVDCGGGDCPPCGTNQGCAEASDCQSQVCGPSQLCSAPSCGDDVLNGTETDIDCGGPTCGPCLDTETCSVDSDCRNGNCSGGTCHPAECTPFSSFAVGSSTLVQCGDSGNTYWTFSGWTTATRVTLSPDLEHFYAASVSRLSKIDQATGAEVDLRDFSLTLGHPAVFTRPTSGDLVTLSTSGGYVFGLNPDDLSTLWSRNLRRPTCSGGDELVTRVVPQVWSESDANFRAVHATDLVLVGTRYGCGTQTTNRVYALSAIDSSIAWTFNLAATSQVNAIQGLALDLSRNLVFATTVKDDPASSQNTVWALKTTTGAKIWQRDLGYMTTAPVLGNGGLHVVNNDGVLYKLDPATGATLWQVQVALPPVEVRALAADPASGRVYLVDSAGFVAAYGDTCFSGATNLWQTDIGGQHAAAATPAILGEYLYVPTLSGRTYQIRATTGAATAYATILPGGPGGDPLVYDEPGVGTRLLGNAGVLRKLCIPWPNTAGDKASLVGPGWPFGRDGAEQGAAFVAVVPGVAEGAVPSRAPAQGLCPWPRSRPES